MNRFLERVGLVHKDPEEVMKEWKRKMRSEKRTIEREIRAVERDQQKLELDIKKLARKGGQQDAIKILAKQIVTSRQTVTKLHTASANIDSLCMQMRTMAAQAAVGRTMKTSTQTMKQMNSLMRLPQMRDTMIDFQREMHNAGMISEMMDDMMFDDDLELEDQVDAEVEKVIVEATLGTLNQAPLAQKGAELFRKGLEREEEEEEDLEVTNLERRLRNLN